MVYLIKFIIYCRHIFWNSLSGMAQIFSSIQSLEPKDRISKIDDQERTLSSETLQSYFGSILPVEISRYILELAWALPVQSAYIESEKTISNGESTYLELVLSRDNPYELVVEVISHDQGWSQFPEDYNTYNNSWTYGTIKAKNFQEIAYRNLHACGDWQLHQKSFSKKSRLLSNIIQGDKIMLNINATFPGWLNSVHSAQLCVYYDVE
eukprot:NODE_830_length_3850_cov_0.215143.p2 type:complete len:209 gc:universal NODE_830_length_3850_cov_0.215143:3168-2542(-)